MTDRHVMAGDISRIKDQCERQLDVFDGRGNLLASLVAPLGELRWLAERWLIGYGEGHGDRYGLLYSVAGGVDECWYEDPDNGDLCRDPLPFCEVCELPSTVEHPYDDLHRNGCPPVEIAWEVGR